jgi:hypothetical protein
MFGSHSVTRSLGNMNAEDMQGTLKECLAHVVMTTDIKYISYHLPQLRLAQ